MATPSLYVLVLTYLIFSYCIVHSLFIVFSTNHV